MSPAGHARPALICVRTRRLLTAPLLLYAPPTSAQYLYASPLPSGGPLLYDGGRLLRGRAPPHAVSPPYSPPSQRPGAQLPSTSRWAAPPPFAHTAHPVGGCRVPR